MHDLDSLFRWNIRKAHKSAVRFRVAVNQSSEVTVDGDQNASIGTREFQKRQIPRIWPQISDMTYIVSHFAEPTRESATGTPID